MNHKTVEDPKPGDNEEQVPTYGLLVINHAYNEGKITFREWLALSREWALQIKEQHKRSVV